jgi:hypothetical protein
VRIPEKQLSGAAWVARFPGSESTAELDAEFGAAVDRFIAALRAAGARVTVSATYRPPERAYMMHWSWELARKNIKAAKIPPMAGVPIEWDHGDEEASVAAAKAMRSGFKMDHLNTSPALRSRHTQRKAIDMSISWSGKLVINDADGNAVTIDTTPRTGMNSKLHEVGKSYGVVKFWRGAKDKPHWSTDGR